MSQNATAPLSMLGLRAMHVQLRRRHAVAGGHAAMPRSNACHCEDVSTPLPCATNVMRCVVVNCRGETGTLETVQQHYFWDILARCIKERTALLCQRIQDFQSEAT